MRELTRKRTRQIATIRNTKIYEQSQGLRNISLPNQTGKGAFVDEKGKTFHKKRQCRWRKARRGGDSGDAWEVTLTKWFQQKEEGKKSWSGGRERTGRGGVNNRIRRSLLHSSKLREKGGKYLKSG